LKIALTIAGSDSGAGAGIQADLKTFAALGVYGTSVITAVTAQNTLGVKSYQEISPEIVADQLEAICTDFEVSAAKTGMLASSKIIEVVVQAVNRYKIANLVVDPVMLAKSGDRLLLPDAEEALVEKLIPLALIVTPNLFEAEVLCGKKVSTIPEMKEAAKKILDYGCKGVVVKGGHLNEGAVDIFYDGENFQELKAKKIATKNDHGTGCTFSAAIAGFVALGMDLSSSVVSAKEYITKALEHSYSVGHGRSPVNHFFQTKISEPIK